jgi:hypothetical protein
MPIDGRRECVDVRMEACLSNERRAESIDNRAATSSSCIHSLGVERTFTRVVSRVRSYARAYTLVAYGVVCACMRAAVCIWVVLMHPAGGRMLRGDWHRVWTQRNPCRAAFDTARRETSRGEKTLLCVFQS